MKLSNELIQAVKMTLDVRGAVYAKTQLGDWVRIYAIRDDGQVQSHPDNFAYFGDPEPNSWFAPKDLETL